MNETYDLCLRGGTVVTPTGTARTDLAITNGRIAALGPSLNATQVIDATDKLILPGGVDVHCHIEQMSGMGLMNADTFETATLSAAMGGTTSLVSFAAQAPGQRLRDAVADYAARAKRGARIDHAFHIIVADPTVPHLEDDLTELSHAGHKSIKLFTTYNIGVDDATILRVMATARMADALVCVHAENDAILAHAKQALLDRGMTAPRHHALAHPRLAEVEAVARICRFAEAMDQPTMLFHISTAEALDEVRRAKSRGAPIWSETCPHYLLSTADVLDKPGVEGAKWMCSPPQRDAADVEALWDGIRDGTIDVISSDHAPYRFDETGKLSAGPTPTFPQIANGMPGLEVRMPLMFNAFVQRGLTVAQFVELCCKMPARLYGFDTKGMIVPGFDADLVIWDPQAEMTYGDDDLHDNVGYNPWSGHSVTGWPETVIQRGKIIVQNGQCLAAPGQGAWLRRHAMGAAPTWSLGEMAWMEADQHS